MLVLLMFGHQSCFVNRSDDLFHYPHASTFNWAKPTNFLEKPTNQAFGAAGIIKQVSVIQPNS